MVSLLKSVLSTAQEDRFSSHKFLFLALWPQDVVEGSILHLLCSTWIVTKKHHLSVPLSGLSPTLLCLRLHQTIQHRGEVDHHIADNGGRFICLIPDWDNNIFLNTFDAGNIPVQFNHLGTACLLMETVNILG